MDQQLNLFSELKGKTRKRSESKKKLEKLNKLDPKSSELIMNKLKLV